MKLTQENLFPYPDTTGMTKDEASMMKIKLERETKEIQREFSRLLFQLQKSLEKFSSLDDVVNLLVHQDDEGWTKKCSSIPQVFNNAKRFCSFFNTGMLKLLIEELGTEQDKTKYEDYKKKFQTFCKNRVCQCPEEELAIMMDKNIEKLGKWEQEQLQFEINRVFKNKTPLIRLLSNEQMQQLSTNQACSPSTSTQVTSHTTPIESTSFTTSSGATNFIMSSEATSFTTACGATSFTTTREANSTISSEATSFTTSSEATRFISPSKATGFITPSEATSSSTNSKASKDTRYNMLMEDTKSAFSQSVTLISENEANKILPIAEYSAQEFIVSMRTWIIIVEFTLG